MNFKKSLRFSAVLCFSAVILSLSAGAAYAQQRARIVQNPQITQTNQPIPQTSDLVSKPVSSRPVNRMPLTDRIVVQNPPIQPLVKKTAVARPTNAAPNYSSSASAARTHYAASTTTLMLSSIQGLYGIPYRYGSTGPNSYDCSGFVWTVFQRAGFGFDRSSAANYWREFEPVEGDERFKFGTLVFFNRLGHVGIVADENGFYHASSSKGITYSPFKGYWGKRIVGFRRVPARVF